jgi:succinate dehydrogenase/fumarate reductase flavoprotein subunit
MRAGAAAIHLTSLQYGPWCSPDEKGYGLGPTLALVIERYGLALDPLAGRRFMNEGGDRAERTEALLAIRNSGRERFPVLVAGRDLPKLVPDPGILERPLARGVAEAFDSLESLCGRYGLPQPSVESEIARYNRLVQSGIDEDFGRDFSAVEGVLVEGPPFYAMRLTAKAHFCQGGVKTDASTRVLSAATLEPIPGLLAAGEIVGGVHGRSRLANNAITEALVFGRLAGLEAAKSA